MNIKTARGVIGTQLSGLKKAHKRRFINGIYEYELRAAGSAFAPYFYLYKRKYGNGKNHFMECGIIHVDGLFLADDVEKRALSIITGNVVDRQNKEGYLY